VAALAEDLRRHLAHEPVSARPDSLAYRSAKFVRRYRSMVAAGLVVVMAVTVGLVGTATQALRAQRERDNALRQLTYAESSSEFIGFLLQQGSDEPFTMPQLLARGERLVQGQFAGDPVQRAYLLLMLAQQYGQARQPNKAEALLLRARDDVRNVDDLSLQVRIECQLALQMTDAGSFDRALPMFDAAIVRLRGTAGSDDERATLAACLYGRAQLVYAREDMASALVDAQAALDLLGTPRPGQLPLAIEARTLLARAKSKLGQSAAAVVEHERTLAEIDTMGRGRTGWAGDHHNDLGVLLSRAGQTLRATQSYERGLEVTRGLRSSLALQTNYAKLLTELGRPHEAMPLIEAALASARASGDERSVYVTSMLGAPTWCAVNDRVRCAAMLADARAGLTRMLPAGHSTLGTLEMTQAQLALTLGDLAAAHNGLQLAVRLFQTASAKSPIGIRALTLLARTEQQLGDLDAAEAHAALAVAQAREALAGFAHSEWLGSALVAQGLVQQARGEAAAAQASWRAALEQLQATVGDAAPAVTEVHGLLAARASNSSP
jgi:tetratricopeptide (TPR) repeat protein